MGRRKYPREHWDAAAEALDPPGKWMKNPSIGGANVKCPIMCTGCGTTKCKTPAAVHGGSGCRQCKADSRRTKPDEWRRRAADLDPPGRWVENPGEGPRKDKHLIECLGCHSVRPVWANNVTTGSACGECKTKERMVALEEWNRRAANLEPQGEWVGDPTILGSDGDCEIKCTECGRTRTLKPKRITPSLRADGTIKKGNACGHCSKPPGPPKVSRERRDQEAAACTPPLKWVGDPTINANTYTAIRCTECPVVFEAKPNDVMHGHRRCPECWKPSREQRDAEAARLDPPAVWIGDPTVASDILCEIECTRCGIPWEAKPNNVQSGHSCPNCSENGFKPALPAFVYLLAKPEGIAKVGISNAGKSIKDRLKRHRRNDYELQRTWAFQVGADARAVEASVLEVIRNDLQLDFAAPFGEDGRRESFNSIPPDGLSLRGAAEQITDFAAGTESWDGGWPGTGDPRNWRPAPS